MWRDVDAIGGPEKFGVRPIEEPAILIKFDSTLNSAFMKNWRVALHTKSSNEVHDETCSSLIFFGSHQRTVVEIVAALPCEENHEILKWSVFAKRWRYDTYTCWREITLLIIMKDEIYLSI